MAVFTWASAPRGALYPKITREIKYSRNATVAVPSAFPYNIGPAPPERVLDGSLRGSARSVQSSHPQRGQIKMSTVEQQVKAIVAEQLGVKAEQVTSAASFVDDLGADSLDTVELVMALEEEFEIEIPDEDAEKITTVQQAIDYINERRTKT